MGGGRPGRAADRADAPPGSRGPCGLRLAERRRATAADRRQAAAEAELARGHSLRRTQKPEACRAGIAPYESAQGGFAGLGLPRRRAEALLGLGLLQHECLHEDEAALQAFTRAEPLFAGDPAFEAFVRYHLGKIRDDLGDLESAIGEYRKALALSRRIGDRAVESVTSNDLGFAFHRRGRYDEAADLFDRALALLPPGDDPAKRANILLNRGSSTWTWERRTRRASDSTPRSGSSARRRTGARGRRPERTGARRPGTQRPGAALEPLRAALALRPPGSRGRAVTLTTLGVAYRQLSRQEDARRAYAEALPIFRGLGDSREQASCLANLGWLEATAGHDAAALEDFDRALGLFRTLADPPDMAWVLEGKARILQPSWRSRSGPRADGTGPRGGRAAPFQPDELHHPRGVLRHPAGLL